MSYTKKGNRRYSYYLCIKDDKRAVAECPLARIAAGDIDRVILNRLAAIFKTPSLLAQTYAEANRLAVQECKNLRERQGQLEAERDAIRQDIINASGDISGLTDRLNPIFSELSEIESKLECLGSGEISNREISDAFDSIDKLWEELFPIERYRLAHLLIEKITVYKDRMRMELKTYGMASLVKELQAENAEMEIFPSTTDLVVSLEIPLMLKRKHGRKVLIAPEMDKTESPVQESLVQHLARAHSWLEMLETGKVANLSQLAEKLKLDRSYVGRTLRLVNLSPEIQASILNGKEPDGLSLRDLRKEIPTDWQEQMESINKAGLVEHIMHNQAQV
ncbi:MAG: hypothetical protein A2X49_00915 [Lentisphaerae bacterium GWF2_52_8]|nr:MAG: hypothetical protein A2X49_00915 [Lentisphaerae bacterium GWF2_52_8]